jgi:hypothetical protein
MINYNYDVESKILFINYIGDIEYNQFPDFINELGQLRVQYELPSTLMILSDYTKGNIKMSIDEIPLIFGHMQQYFSYFNRIAEAFIHVNPFETALSLIARDQAANQDTYISEVFSSEQAAVAWLKKQ